jgi:2-hydroxymuconate-semialdehyde hydrolase
MDALLNWEGLIPLLAKHFRCYAIDLVGFGETSHPSPLPEGAGAWMALRQKQVEMAMDELEASPAFVVGNSRGGGAILMRMLLQSPSRIRGAVVMGAAGFMAGPSPAATSTREELIKNFYDAPSIERMAEIVPLFFHDKSALSVPVEKLVKRRFEQATRPGAEAAYRAMTTGGMPAAPQDHKALAAIDRPIILVHGARDQVSDPLNSLALQRHLPGASLHVLPEAGHWSHIDQPGLFAGLVKAFADGALAPRGGQIPRD